MIILQDTKEKMPWSFSTFGQCDEQKATHLEEGDYTIEEYPKLVAIERKRTANELANNLGRKYDQFCTELEKLKQYRFRYVLCEFTEHELINYPHASNLPPNVVKQIRMSGKFLYSRIKHLQSIYEIEFIYCGTRTAAMKKAMELLVNAENIFKQERVDAQRSSASD